MRTPELYLSGVHLLQCYLALERTDAARETLDRIKERKQKYAAEAADQLQQLSTELTDSKPEEASKQQQRQLNKLRARAGTNQAAVAFLTASVLHAEGRHEEALSQLTESEAAQMAVVV